MYKRTIAITLAFIFLMGCSGCSGPWRRKFVRKKKAEVKEEPVLHPKDYSKEFTNKQLYANHFAFWRNAESEFIHCLKDQKSRKRMMTYTSYAMVELKKLYDLLVEEKQKELLPFLEELKVIAAKISQPNYVNSHRNLLVSRSSKHYRTVSRKFSYYSMKEYIRAEEEMEEQEESVRPEEGQEGPEEPDKPKEPEKTEGEPERPEAEPEMSEVLEPEELKRPEAEPEKSEEPEKPSL